MTHERTSEKRDVVVLGAGFSRSLSCTMPMMSDLTQKVWKLFKDELGASGIPANPDDPGRHFSNVESLLSQLARRYPWLERSEYHRNLGCYHKIIDFIADKITETEREVDEDSEKWQAHRRLVETWHRTQATVLTFNYDTLVERLASKVVRYDSITPDMLDPVPILNAIYGVGSPRSLNVPTFSLYKLHGCLTWYVHRQPGEGSVHRLGLRGDPRVDMYDQEIMKNGMYKLMVPPIQGKDDAYVHPIFGILWADAMRKLKEASRVVFIGYSLPQMDSLSIQLFRTALWERKGVRVVVVNNDKKMQKHYKNQLKLDKFEFVEDTRKFIDMECAC